ncbi:hypothetical protein SIN8267_02858 [Sinobacterium norvegicum]|uniref:Uncharacterized protein n=2 Tax=Sinobacterium norvegicum TaxID=1641715 RepID=A0ABN8EP36_9GAMM|nr:hypothetical protein SIN8267_02858 [Sinobacterium norvegicum]
MAMDEHECCEPSIATSCETGTELNLQQWSEWLNVAIYLAVALLVCWSLLSQFRAEVQRYFVTKSPPIYLLTCVFRH